MGTFQKFCLRWNNHTTNLLGTLGHILASEQHSDVTLCCQGEVWRLHKLVLCASSSHFEKLLGMLPPGQTPIVVLDGPHPQDVGSLIHFIYHGEVNVDQENLASLLRTAESLKIKGLAEVSSVTGGGGGGGEHKSPAGDADRQRMHSRGRSRPSSRQSAPIYALGSEYPLGMYGLVSQAVVSPQTHVPDPMERDPSPLNLSFSGSLKNIHDETPQERQERRNRLDDLLYAATERSKKEERREARREAREAALREAAAARDGPIALTHDSGAVLLPAPKRARTAEPPPRTGGLPAHPAFHIPLLNLTVPPGGGGGGAHPPPHAAVPAQNPHSTEVIPHAEHVPTCLQPPQQQDEQQEQADDVQEIETLATKPSPVKAEKFDVPSDAGALEDPAVNSDESDTQSAPETPSDLSVMPHPQARTPTPTPANSIPPSSQLTCGAADEPNSSSSACGTPTAPSSAINGSSSAPSVTPPSDAGEEKVTPYFHSILRQVADGGSGGEANTTSAQRVTINMRTFKEEWRRQLLVDYDTRTNMSICMLCFTTFKSYDGPRKNTYVKHAKRFHPSLEEYSEEERDLIISMYEKYHKYDVDMQKEVNKSYRAANAIVALGKKGAKHCDIAAVIAGSNGLTGKAGAEVEGHDEGADVVVSEACAVKEEEAHHAQGKSRSHTPDSEISLEANEKLSDSFDAEEGREKLDNNNITAAQLSKRSQMNTRAKAAAAAAAAAAVTV